jgi:beta-lactamase superfamily II metal-dependent hydrolase
MIVDSCRDQRNRRQPAIKYLERIGCDPSEVVRVVVATHWHNDHVRGLSEVVSSCVNSEFWTSSAMTSREALVLTGRIGPSQLTKQSPLREYYGVLERLHIREQGTGQNTIKTAEVGSLVYTRSRRGATEATILALSPHSAAVDVTRTSFALASDQVDRGVVVAPDIHPNHAAIALRVDFGRASAILGSDLQCDAPGGGWQAIVADQRGRDEVTIFKVPHHGSDNAHDDQVWTDLLQEEVVAATAPFRPQHLPRQEMIETLVERAGRGFLSAPPKKPSQRQSPRRTRALMIGSTIRIEEAEGRSGHVRIRCSSASGDATSADVDLALPALRLESLLAL